MSGMCLSARHRGIPRVSFSLLQAFRVHSTRTMSSDLASVCLQQRPALCRIRICTTNGYSRCPTLAALPSAERSAGQTSDLLYLVQNP